MPSKKTSTTPKSPSKNDKKEDKEVSLLKSTQKHLQPKNKKKREVKKPQRWEEDTAVHHQPTRFEIPKGKGKKLVECPHVHAAIKKIPSSDKRLQCLHTWAIGRPLKRTPVKKDLEEFSGVKYDSEHTREKLLAKITSNKKEVVRAVLKTVGIAATSTDKDDLATDLVNWLEKPKDAAKEIDVGSVSKSRSRSRSSSPARKKSKKDEDGPTKPRSAYNYWTAEERPKYHKSHPDKSFAETSKALGKKWSALSEKDKKPYLKLAEKDKDRYEKEKGKSKSKSKSPKKDKKKKSN